MADYGVDVNGMPSASSPSVKAAPPAPGTGSVYGEGGGSKSCPMGSHWDDSLQKCVKDDQSQGIKTYLDNTTSNYAPDTGNSATQSQPNVAPQSQANQSQSLDQPSIAPTATQSVYQTNNGTDTLPVTSFLPGDTPPTTTTQPQYSPLPQSSPTTGDQSNNRDYVISQIQAWAAAQPPGTYINPSVTSNPGYWADQIIANGGWTSTPGANPRGGQHGDNISYFQGRMGQSDSGDASGGGGGGNGTFTPTSAPPPAYVPPPPSKTSLSTPTYTPPPGYTVPDTAPKYDVAKYNPTQYLTQGLVNNAIPTYTPSTIDNPTFQNGAIPTYTAANIKTDQFQQSPLQGLSDEAIKAMLANGSLSPAVVAQMKESSKDLLSQNADQQRQQILQDAARRGVSGGGASQASMDNLAMTTQGNLSKSYSGIDIAKAQQDRLDQQNAVAAAQASEAQNLNTYLGTQNLSLNTQNANAQQGYQAFGSQKDASDTAFSRSTTEDAAKLAAQQAQADQNYKAYGSNATASDTAFSRSVTGAQLSLAQQQAQAQENQYAHTADQSANAQTFGQWLATQGLQSQSIQNTFNNWLQTQGLTQQSVQNAFNNWARTQDLSRTSAQDAFTNWLATQNLGLSITQLHELSRQFDAQHALDLAKYYGS